MTQQAGEMPFLTFRLPQKELDKLTQVAREKGFSRSELARRILARGLVFADDFASKAGKRRARPRPRRVPAEAVA